MQLIVISGNLGRDSELNQINGSNGPISVLNFSVAVRSSQKDQGGNYLTKWYACALWGKRADAMAPYLTKGTRVSLSGEPDVEVYQSGQSGQWMAKPKIRVDQIALMGGGQQNQSPPQGQQQPSYQKHASPPPSGQPMGVFNNSQGDDDIPF